MFEDVTQLTPREQQVLKLVAKGLTTWAIAQALVPPCGEETVKEHLKRIFAKLDVHNRAEAVAKWLSASGP